MTKLYDVVIAGGGPIGLFLACELGLSGASVLVLERDPTRESPWKSMPMGLRGMNTQSIEALYRRGLLGKFFDLDARQASLQKTSTFKFAGHFAGIGLDANKLDLDRFPYRLAGPALAPGPTSIEQMEGTLAERAEGLGVTILRGHGVSKIVSQDAHSVTVEAGEGRLFRGRWLVGCDGGRSVVRKAAGFDFVGTEAKFTAYGIKAEFDHPEKLEQGFHLTKTGMYIVGRGGVLYLIDFDGGAFDRSKEITIDHLQEILTRVSGIPDLNITKLDLASSFTDRSKQASSYRKDRVLLAGDAAHIHPPIGSQGLNLGLGDAINLGWKLAATLRRESSTTGLSDLALLDTYESERHPVGAWVLEWTRAQVSTIQPDLYGQAVQALIRDVVKTIDGTNLLIDRVWGLSQRYSLGDDEGCRHPLVGCSAPDFELSDGSRLGSKMEGGRGLLVAFYEDTALRRLVADSGCEARVDYVGLGAKDQRGLRALLVRPDGIVAWVADEGAEPDLGAAKTALERWFAS